MPVVAFNEKDALQHELLRERAVDAPPVVHRVPTSADFLEAVRLGLGWGVLPEPQLDPDLEAGWLVLLGTRRHVDVHLYWQRWRLDSPLLASLTDDVRRAAAHHLRQK
jgi:LysR family transcriptional regulator (chromosome initiation inhibitor)